MTKRYAVYALMLCGALACYILAGCGAKPSQEGVTYSSSCDKYGNRVYIAGYQSGGSGFSVDVVPQDPSCQQ